MPKLSGMTASCCFRITLVCAATLLVAACGTTPPGPVASRGPVESRAPDVRVLPPVSPTARTEVVLRALSLVGTEYRWGGNHPEEGLDCSGFVRHVWREAAGLSLPRRAEDMSRAGREVTPAELVPGDLVFFNTLKRPNSHVGIYIGNEQFVHAPAAGKRVRVERMAGAYWTQRFDGARRLVADATLAER